MVTDNPPRTANRAGFLESDRIKTLDLPQDGRLLACAKSIEAAMKSGTTADVRRACAEFLDAASEFYKAPACGIRVLPARPLRVSECWSMELFGDFLLRNVLSRLCHEFCQHLGIQARRAACSRGRPIYEAISPPSCRTGSYKTTRNRFHTAICTDRWKWSAITDSDCGWQRK